MKINIPKFKLYESYDIGGIVKVFGLSETGSEQFMRVHYPKIGAYFILKCFSKN
jgi:hypothetical protein